MNLVTGMLRDVLGDPTFRTVFETWPDAIVVMREDGTIADLNRHAEKMFGWPLEEAVGCEMAELIIPGRYRERHHAGLDRYLRSGEGPLLFRRNMVTALKRDGEEFPVELYICPLTRRRLFRRPQTIFVGFIRDALEGFRTEEEPHGPQRPFPN